MPLDSSSVANKARNLMSWFKRGLTQLSDPDKEQRIETAAVRLQKELRRLMKDFELTVAVEKLGIDERDKADVCLKVFSTILGRAWNDGELSDAEAKLVNWAALVLEIPEHHASEMKIIWGKAWFERNLAQAFDDGQITAEEAQELNLLAKRLGTTLPILISRYFSEESESFLRGIFLSVIEDGKVTDHEWSRLIRSVEFLGFSRSEFLMAVEPQARQLVEHVLADCKSDGLLSTSEDETLRSLLSRFELSEEFIQYVEDELVILRKLTEVKQGKLPSISKDILVERRAGEIVHLQGRVTYTLAKQRRGEISLQEYVGWLVLTDSRFVFISDLKNFQVNLRSVIRCDQPWHSISGGVEIHCGSVGSGIYVFHETPVLMYEILKGAIGKANQTLVQETEGMPTRHIPRETRQRVWQKYGGKCAQCSERSYLEFDHIIPVAKGGGNSEANIQVLCRKCNLAKSDQI